MFPYPAICTLLDGFPLWTQAMLFLYKYTAYCCFTLFKKFTETAPSPSYRPVHPIPEDSG